MTPDEFDQYLEDLETRLERLRSLYEQYFMGMERIEPSVARKDVDRRFWALRRERMTNTARRFKLQMLVQRYNTLQQYWQRTCREIDQGTYRRHRLKAERSLATSPAQAAAHSSMPPARTTAQDGEDARRQATRSAEEDLKALLASDFDPAAEVDAALDAIFIGSGPSSLGPSTPPPKSQPPRPSPPVPPPARSSALPSRAPEPPRPPPRPNLPAQPSLPPRPGVAGAARLPPPNPPTPLPRPVPRPPLPTAPPRPDSSLSESRIRELHQGYLAARQGSPTSPMTLDKLAQNLRATEARLRQQHQGKRIDFDIVVKDGKPVLRPKIS